MPSGTAIEQRDVVLVPFPFSDMSAVKRRPAIILSHASFNRQRDDLIICQVTSKLVADPYAVSLTQAELEEGMLKVESRIKPYRITALDQQLIGKRIGRITEEKFREVLDALQRCFFP